MLGFAMSGISQKPVVTGKDDFHYVDPWPPEDCVVRGLHIDHIELCDDVRISEDWEYDCDRQRVSFSSNPYKFEWV